jgi:alpha-galactosidase
VSLSRSALACGFVCVALGLVVSGVASATPVTGGVPPVIPRGGGYVSAAAPYMGWNTYYGVGGIFDQATILSVARALLRRGLAQAGYRIVWLDFGWASGARTAGGQIIVSRRQWPRGLRWLTGWLHHHGLLAGIYTDAGASGCRDEGLGSLGHYRQDADSFAAWGFDAVKVDFCGAGQEGLDPRPLYTAFASAVARNASDRRMLLNVCNFWVPGQINGAAPSLANSSYDNALWAPRIAQSWRTDTDIGSHGSIKWVNVVRNLEADERHQSAAGPGHWNDPDYLGPQLGMTAAEAQGQLTMWAMVAAPLILGSDPRKLSNATIQMLENPAVIAVDQDPLGIQGAPIATEGQVEVWVKPLVAGGRAVAFLNPGDTPAPASTTPQAIGAPTAHIDLIDDVWTGSISESSGPLSVEVPPDTALLYVVNAAP